MIRAVSITLAFMFLATPLLSSAQSSGDAQTSALMTEIAQLEAQIEALTQTTTSPSAIVPASSAPANQSLVCPTFTRSLSAGARGADVTALQTYLLQQGIFASPATGYFGSITASSVGNWQIAHGIVANITTPGWGIVGPRTSAAITSSCYGKGVTSSAGTSSTCSVALPPASECATGWKPVTDANACTQYYTCVIPLPVTVATSSVTQPVYTGSCPFVATPTCSGTLSVFSRDQNGCVTGYQCLVQ